MPRITYRDAVNQALAEEMRRDDSIIIFGEDVALYEGSFKVTRGLLKEFGDQRVIDTPISEAAIVGAAIGAAMGGLRPVPELMTVNFAYVALDQICNHLALMRYTQGCVGRCDFCPSWAQTDKRYLKRSIDLMIEEIQTIHEPYIYFVDEESLLDTKHSLAFAQAIKDAGIKKRWGMPLPKSLSVGARQKLGTNPERTHSVPSYTRETISPDSRSNNRVKCWPRI